MRRASRRESLWMVTTRGYRTGPTRSHIRSPTTHFVNHGLVLDLPRASGLRGAACPAARSSATPPRSRVLAPVRLAPRRPLAALTGAGRGPAALANEAGVTGVEPHPAAEVVPSPPGPSHVHRRRPCPGRALSIGRQRSFTDNHGR
jgi:hypothetical protein